MSGNNFGGRVGGETKTCMSLATSSQGVPETGYETFRSFVEKHEGT